MRPSGFFLNRMVFIITKQKDSGEKVGNKLGMIFPANVQSKALCRVDPKVWQSLGVNHCLLSLFFGFKLYEMGLGVSDMSFLYGTDQNLIT